MKAFSTLCLTTLNWIEEREGLTYKTTNTPGFPPTHLTIQAQLRVSPRPKWQKLTRCQGRLPGSHFPGTLSPSVFLSSSPPHRVAALSFRGCNTSMLGKEEVHPTGSSVGSQAQQSFSVRNPPWSTSFRLRGCFAIVDTLTRSFLEKNGWRLKICILC